MKILYIAHRIPYPPTKGEKIRAFYQIRHLSKEHAVHLACLVDDRADLEHIKTLRTYCASVDTVYRGKVLVQCSALLALFPNIPLSVFAFYSRVLAKKIAQRLRAEKIDRIVVFSAAMAEYVRHISTIPKIMDFVDADSEKWRLFADYHPRYGAWLYRLEADRLARYEEAVANTFEWSVFVSTAEAELLRRRVPHRPIAVIPNGVDVDYFAPAATYPATSKPPVVVFTGAMDYFPNVDAVRYFCREMLPLIHQALPETQFYIVGRQPTRQVRGLGRQHNVTVTGWVPDVRPYLARACVAVAPLRIARGVQNKVLEAMAMGVPVVSTSVALQGIRATAEDGIRIADDPQRFAHEVLSLLHNPRLQRQCALQVRQYVLKHHNWEEHGSSLTSLLHAL